MTWDEAVAECERWHKHLNYQSDKARKMAQIAAKRRRGEIDEGEGRRQMRVLDMSPTVYDGAKLEQATRVLMKGQPK
jgi:hypothetical protein